MHSRLIYLLAANTGGLLGLFMGFSVLSLIEILYFTTLRPFCKNVQQHRAKAHAKSKIHKSQSVPGVTHSNGLKLISPPNYKRNGPNQQNLQTKFDLAKGKLSRFDMRLHQRKDWIDYPYMN